jgi:poly(3-hydroxybutyrate) depolymerase
MRLPRNDASVFERAPRSFQRTADGQGGRTVENPLGMRFKPRSAKLFGGITAVAVLLLSASFGFSADWPPTLDVSNTTTQARDGRVIERYTHGPRETWGYPAGASGEWDYPPAQETGPAQQNHNSFYLVAPKNPRENAPLCVMLHSANRTAYDYLGFACLERKTEGGDQPATAMTNPPDDFYALFLNSTNAEWWGWSQTRENRMKGVNAPPPAELRVLDTIEWAVNRCKIDRNRIYLCGVSMGGCGTLGIGMPHGEIFAAVRATVPAGTGYEAYRMGGIAPLPAMDAPQAERDAWLKRASAAGLPDPPVIVDFSSPQDGWSTTQPALVNAAQAGRLPLVLGWGPFGHPTFSYIIAKYPLCQIALAYPWLDIRKNEAYPVFTRASTDQRCPWLNAPADYDGSGQMNAWFRWKNKEDEPSSFAMQLWIAHPAVKDPPGMPDTAKADLTLRRLQHFEVKAGRSYAWQTTREGHAISSGRITVGDNGLLTIPQVGMSTVAADLSVKPEPVK